MHKRPYTRVNFFSNPAVQGKILLLFFALVVMLVGTNWIMSLRSLLSFGSAVQELPASDSVHKDIALLLEQQQTVLVIQLVVYSILSFVLVALGAILISHHIGGPLHNLVKYCRGVVSGTEKPREIRFRKHDIPQDVCAAFNEFQRHHSIIPPASTSDTAKKTDTD